MGRMNYRSFGRLDWKLSGLGFGTMKLPAVSEDPSVIRRLSGLDILPHPVQLPRRRNTGGYRRAALCNIQGIGDRRHGASARWKTGSAKRRNLSNLNAAPAKRSAAEWALDWVWNHPEVSLLLSAMSTLTQVQQNLGAAGMSEAGMLAPGELDLIIRVRDAYNALIRVPCTTCSYCMPWPQEVNILGMFQLVDEGSMFGDRDMQRKRYGRMRGEGSSADSCIRCGACEEDCARHISIRDQLADVAGQLG